MSDLKVRNFAEESASGNNDFLDFSQPAGEGTNEGVVEEVTEDLIVAENTANDIDDAPAAEEETPVEEVVEVIETPAVEAEKIEPELNDETALKYLNEKLGKDFKSLDDFKQPSSENPLEKDPYLKALYEWRERTGRPIEDWYKYQKDYTTLSEVDTVRELLKYEYPNFTDDEIELEMEKYSPDEYDSEKEAALKNLEVKKLATRGREVLSKLKMDLNTPDASQLSPEIKEDLDFAEHMKTAVQKQKEDNTKYLQGISQVAAATENFEIALGDGLKINFKLPEQAKKELPSLIETMPHWKNPDGTWNHKAVVDDAIKIKYFEQLFKLAYDQGVNSGIDNLVTDTKNVTLNTSKIVGQNDGKKGVQIEDLDDYLGNKGIKVRF